MNDYGKGIVPVNRLGVVVALCALAIITVLVWPRFFPRYVDAPGGAVDRWTGRTCTLIATREELRAESNPMPLLCVFDDGRHITQGQGSTRWDTP